MYTASLSIHVSYYFCYNCSNNRCLLIIGLNSFNYILIMSLELNVININHNSTAVNKIKIITDGHGTVYTVSLIATIAAYLNNYLLWVTCRS